MRRRQQQSCNERLSEFVRQPVQAEAVYPELSEFFFREAQQGMYGLQVKATVGKTVVYVERNPQPRIVKSLLYFYEAFCTAFHESGNKGKTFVFLPIYGKKNMQRRFGSYIRYFRPAPDWQENAALSHSVQKPEFVQYIYDLLIEKSGLEYEQSAAFLQIDGTEVNVLYSTDTDHEDFVTNSLSLLTYNNITEMVEGPENTNYPFINDYLASLTQYGNHAAFINLLTMLTTSFRYHNKRLSPNYLLYIIDTLRTIHGNLTLSPVMVSKQFRILLPAFDLEIEMDSLPKTLYILFLQNPNGLYFKDLPDYLGDLKTIYCSITNQAEGQGISARLKELLNLRSNLFYETCLCIKEAFLVKIDDHLAQQYYINGVPGQSKNVPVASEKNMIRGV